MITKFVLSFLVMIAFQHSFLCEKCIAQVTPPSGDWFASWCKCEEENEKNRLSDPFRFPPPDRDDLLQRLSYGPARYLVPAYLYASQVLAIPDTIRQKYLNIAHNDYLSLMFNSDYYRDIGYNIAANPNGLNDNINGWYNNRFTSNFVIPDSLSQNVWYTMKIRVFDNNLFGYSRKCSVQVWLNSNKVYQEVYSPVDTFTFKKGTIALLSGWSDIRVKNLQINNIADQSNPELVYDLNTNKDTFFQDWIKVRNDADGSLTSDWYLDVSSGEIYCNAASDLRYDIPANSRFQGKYASLILDTVKYQQNKLKNVEISFSIFISKRNLSNAESGIALRWISRDPGFAYEQGEKNIDVPSYPYFKPYAEYIAIKLRPHNCLQVIQHRKFNNNYKWWYAPWDEDPECALNGIGYADDGHTYEGQIMGATGLFAMLDPLRGSVFIKQAEATDGIIPKWEKIWSRNKADWNYGSGASRGSRTFGGWKEGLLWPDYLCRIGLMFSRLYHAGQLYSSFYSTNYRDIAHEFFRNIFVVDQSSHAYQWRKYRDYIGEIDAGAADAGHSGPIIEFLMDAHHDSSLTGIHYTHMDTLTRTFTEKMWNKRLDHPSISAAVNGAGGELGNNSASSSTSEWPLLSKYDFKVWEIYDSYYGSDHTTWTTVYGRVDAEMLYTVRYGIPKNLQLDTIRTQIEHAYVLRWQPPSDYPIGLNGTPGTRLKFYNIYRHDRLIGDTTWSGWTQLDSISIPQLQQKQEYPWWTDTIAPKNVNKEYEYIVRTQDWSVGLKNESFDSNPLTVRYTINSVRISTDIASQEIYPNPFRESAIIQFSLTHWERVVVKVFDLLGREVKTLFDDEAESGMHTVQFKAENLPNGVYQVVLQSGTNAVRKNIVVMR